MYVYILAYELSTHIHVERIISSILVVTCKCTVQSSNSLTHMQLMLSQGSQHSIINFILITCNDVCTI